jgi:FKBP-type peptidyl-prolyl cis-trans isomerase
MKLTVITSAALAIIILASSCNDQPSEDASVTFGDEVELTTTLDSLSYAIGITVATNFEQMRDQGLEEIDIPVMASALESSMKGEDLVLDREEAGLFLEQYFSTFEKLKAERNEKEGKDFLVKNRGAEGVFETESGLQYKIITEGSGIKPTMASKVTTHYHGTFLDGAVFDSSIDRGEPTTFEMTGVIPGWQEALQLMPVGSKWIIWVPAELAYGVNAGPGGPNRLMKFEIELIDVE